MAEILYRVVQKIQPDPYLNAGLLQQYDTVVIQPDFWEWSVEELTSPDWLIIKLPESTEEELASFLAPELPPLDNPTKPCWRRLFYLNPDAPFPLTRPVLGGVMAFIPTETITEEPYKLEKAPYPDPLGL